jgi:hypothetical protein
LDELLWYAIQPATRSARYVAPSWSWASIEGEISNAWWIGQERQSYCFLGSEDQLVSKLQVDMQYQHPDVDVGRTTGGKLVLRGILQEVGWRDWRMWPLLLDQTSEAIRDSNFEEEHNRWYPDDQPDPTWPIWRLPLVRKQERVLGLAVTPWNGESRHVWRRVGLFDMHDPPEYLKLPLDWTPRRVIII